MDLKEVKEAFCAEVAGPWPCKWVYRVVMVVASSLFLLSAVSVIRSGLEQTITTISNVELKEIPMPAYALCGEMAGEWCTYIGSCTAPAFTLMNSSDAALTALQMELGLTDQEGEPLEGKEKESTKCSALASCAKCSRPSCTSTEFRSHLPCVTSDHADAKEFRESPLFAIYQDWQKEENIPAACDPQTGTGESYDARTKAVSDALMKRWVDVNGESAIGSSKFCYNVNMNPMMKQVSTQDNPVSFPLDLHALGPTEFNKGAATLKDLAADEKALGNEKLTDAVKKELKAIDPDWKPHDVDDWPSAWLITMFDPDMQDPSDLKLTVPVAVPSWNARSTVGVTMDVTVDRSHELYFFAPKDDADLKEDKVTRLYKGTNSWVPITAHTSSTAREEVSVDVKVASFMSTRIVIRKKSFMEVWTDLGGAWGSALLVVALLFKKVTGGKNGTITASRFTGGKKEAMQSMFMEFGMTIGKQGVSAAAGNLDTSDGVSGVVGSAQSAATSAAQETLAADNLKKTGQAVVEGQTGVTAMKDANKDALAQISKAEESV